MERLDEHVPTILIADDDELICMLISRALQSRGFQVTVAHTRAESSRASDGSQFDLVIVDAHMPGPDLATTLVGMAASQSHTPILVISGDLDRPAWLPQHIAFLPKPFGLADFHAEVSQLLRLPT